MQRKRLTSEEDDVTQRVVATTKKGKKYLIGQYTTGYFYVHFKDGGKLPNVLKGRYIRYEDAENAINGYLAGK